MDTLQFISIGVSAFLSAGVAWGVLVMKSKHNTTRIEEIKVSTDQDIALLRREVQQLARNQMDHRTETTDRLARIETKLDVLLLNKGN